MDNKLGKLREIKGLSQTDLANRLGVSQRTISKWEIGKSTPKPYQMSYLEDYFGVPKEKIFFGAFNYKTKLKTVRITSKISGPKKEAIK